MPLLATKNLTSFYGDFQALFGIDFEIDEGQTAAIIGANGAGKSTFLKTITGLLPREPGSVHFAGEDISALRAPDIFRKGIAMVPEGRRLFPSLSVEENLLIGCPKDIAPGYWTLKTVYELFPVLKERRNNAGTALSGGQQQMVAIGRALMSNPKLLLCDEISLGLAPVIIKDIYAAVPKIKSLGTSMIIVEQDIVQATAVADKIFCFLEGHMQLSGAPGDLSKEEIHEAYFGH